MDQGVLELWQQGMRVSVQEAYGLLCQSASSLERYLVYAHLRRSGCISVDFVFFVLRKSRLIDDIIDAVLPSSAYTQQFDPSPPEEKAITEVKDRPQSWNSPLISGIREGEIFYIF